MELVEARFSQLTPTLREELSLCALPTGGLMKHWAKDRKGKDESLCYILDNGRVAGWACLVALDSSYAISCFVQPEFRRQGLASGLIKRLLEPAPRPPRLTHSMSQKEWWGWLMRRYGYVPDRHNGFRGSYPLHWKTASWLS